MGSKIHRAHPRTPHSCVKKILITGAGGFIGRAILEEPGSKIFEIHAVSQQEAQAQADLQWHTINLHDAEKVQDLVRRIRPDILLHLAWYTEHGKYWQAEENILWVESSLNLLRSFSAAGGRRVVMTGTCAEYDWKYEYCNEDNTPINPATLYGSAKDALRRVAEAYCKTKNIDFAWGRVFFPYGPAEAPTRLISSVIRSLLAGKIANCSAGTQIRDYIFRKDLARGILALADSQVQGVFNLGSGEPHSIKELVMKIAAKLGRPELINLGALPTREDEPHLLIADMKKTHHSLKWQTEYSLDAGLDACIDYWRLQKPSAETSI